MSSKLKVTVLDNPADQEMCRQLDREREVISRLLRRNGEPDLPSQEGTSLFLINPHNIIWFLGYYGDTLIGIAALVPVTTPRKIYGLIEELITDMDSPAHASHTDAIRRMILEKVIKWAKKSHMSYLNMACHTRHQALNHLLQGTSNVELVSTKIGDDGTNLYRIDVT